MELKLTGAIMEKSSPEEENELIEILASKLESATFYRRNLRPGVVYDITFDWMAVIGLTSSAITIGQALWAAYKKVISSKKANNPDSTTKLIFQLKDEENNLVQIVIGDEFNTEEEFLPEFQRRVESTFKQGKGGQVNTKKVFEESIHWKRIK
ncbi:MAG: hypothetical protein WBW94_17385 [Anaerolineales bacterium]